MNQQHDTTANGPSLRDPNAPQRDAGAPFEWSDAFLLGYGPMDDTHHEFVTCVRRLLDSDDDGLLAALEAFAVHAHQHFDQEREWMTGTGFPAADCHIDEHNAVLASVDEVLALMRDDAGRYAHIVRSLTAELVRWFPGHADYLDAPLSQWMVKRRHGGVPVVIKRKSTRDA